MIGIHVAQLDIPSTWGLHDGFHVSLLKPFHPRPSGSPPPLPPVENGLPVYQLDKILAHLDKVTSKGKCREYLVQWHGLSPDLNSWETADHLPPESVTSYDSS